MPSSTITTTPSVLRFFSSRSLTTPRPPTTTADDPLMADSDHSSSKPQPSKSASFSGINSDINTNANANTDENHLPLQSTLTTSSDTDDLKVNEDKEDEDDEVLPEVDFESRMRVLAPEIDEFSELLGKETDGAEVPDGFEKFAVMMEEEISKYESGIEPGKWYKVESGESPLLEAVEKMCKLVEALARYQSEGKYAAVIDRATNVVQRAMVFLEEEFRCLLEESRSVGELDQLDSSDGSGSGKTNRQDSSSTNQETDMCLLAPSPEPAPYSPETVAKLAKIAAAMVSAGYETECCQVYSIARRNALEDELTKMGFEKISIDDIQRLPWLQLERELITNWGKVCKKCITVIFPEERRLCTEVFTAEVTAGMLSNLCRGVVIQLVNFAEAVALTKKASEKLFKLLDLYEGLGDLIPVLDEVFPSSAELKSETAMVKTRLGEVAVSIFSGLVSLIKADNAKTPVPAGVPHPLTRWLMNYITTCVLYKDTLEHLLIEHGIQDTKDDNVDDVPDTNSDDGRAQTPSLFECQLVEMVNSLDANMEAKSKLYKDLSLTYIFLMNNTRYIITKIKKLPEVQLVMLGDNRKRSSDLRQHHKNYTRETWSKVLGCLRDEGLMHGKGSVNKPVLKERLKSFNAMFEEIHRTQSLWKIEDPQLQSEVRVSISAVVVPAYRSFLGRFGQYLDAGRQTEKYVKFGPEELETMIDELFTGPPAVVNKTQAPTKTPVAKKK